ncbi:MAG: pyridoxine 5'-phosphate synthase [Bacteroidetes bacterium]|nr:pyridoxine 5'-phosphate synthase [Bacteroidota bacterium]MBK7505376.1 pyridoxine 5'-phosphate synthase [Bacteroidota bacterium]MBK8672079.1 pyridoxine 5'-phosphate synthase [Bacteroidota bacterium]MBL0288075.1 pyridoxine 5'-phosphate synthase [Bacteroidota bacterium]
MVRLSVNLNKVALLRNSRGNDYPNLLKVALDCERFGADGITLHPRPDERHAKFEDVELLKEHISTELNVEGYPNRRFIELIKKVKPAQCTLVPDEPGALTSDHGWDTIKNKSFLEETIFELKKSGARISLFIDPIEQFIEGAKLVGADNIEFYTGPFAKNFPLHPIHAVEKFSLCAHFASNLELGINAGHDLNLENLKYFKENIPNLIEVSIGHALITDSLYYGLENTIGMYKRCLVP